jgi:hypothetical protein
MQNVKLKTDAPLSSATAICSSNGVSERWEARAGADRAPRNTALHREALLRHYLRRRQRCEGLMPKGRDVRVRTACAVSAICAGEWDVAPMEPSAPYLLTAQTSAGVSPPSDMGAWMGGCRSLPEPLQESDTP